MRENKLKRYALQCGTRSVFVDSGEWQRSSVSEQRAIGIDQPQAGKTQAA